MKNFLGNSHRTFADAMGRMNRQMEEANAAEEAKLLGLPYINMTNSPIDLNVLGFFTPEEAKTYQAVPFFLEHNELRVGAVNPKLPALLERLKRYEQRYKIHLFVVSKSGLQRAMGYYEQVVIPQVHHEEIIAADPNVNYADIVKLWQQSPETMGTNVTDIVNKIFGIAMQYDASDIHLEPEEHILKLRYRIDGVLQDLGHVDRSLQPPIVSRIKIISRLKLNVTNLPQDGRLTFLWGKDPVDVRVSSLPSAYGEGIVLRLLGVGITKLALDDLGFVGRSYKIIEAELQKPNGMIVTTGPTGSGKSTTLYAFLNELNEPGVKIITIEDPIEYKLEGIQQTPIDHNAEFGFAKALRSILRQDPDIVMVGEIRDGETADTALQAALTGHIVLATLHTNDASGAVPRLLVMGSKPFIIAPALNAIIAQRLVRRLCTGCKQATVLSEELMNHVKKILADIPPAAEVQLPQVLQFYNAPGCDKCKGLGYKGRIGIYEVVHVNDIMKGLILNNASMLDMKHQATKDGTVTMAQDGLLKALDGITDVEEVFRVSGD